MGLILRRNKEPTSSSEAVGVYGNSSSSSSGLHHHNDDDHINTNNNDDQYDEDDDNSSTSSSKKSSSSSKWMKRFVLFQCISLWIVILYIIESSSSSSSPLGLRMGTTTTATSTSSSLSSTQNEESTTRSKGGVPKSSSSSSKLNTIFHPLPYQDDSITTTTTPWKPKVIEIQTINPDTFWEDIIWYFTPLETKLSSSSVSSSSSLSSVPNVNGNKNFRNSINDTCPIYKVTSKVIHTNYTNDVLQPISKFIIYDDLPVIVSSTSTSSTGTVDNTESSYYYATCKFTNYQYSAHLPHFMQQFFRCWSFWQHYLQQVQAQVHIPKKYQPIFLLPPKKSNHYRRAMIRPYTLGLIQLLPKMGIQINYQKDQKGIGGSNSNNNNNNNNNATPTTTSTTTGNEKDQQQQTDGDVSCSIIGPLHSPTDISFQVESINHMQLLRENVRIALQWKNDTNTEYTAGCQRRKRQRQQFQSQQQLQVVEPRIVILNRKHSRKLENSNLIKYDLQQYLNLSYTIPEIYFERITFQEQIYSMMTEIDILITPHGAQETSLIFLSKCSSIFEIIPHGYYYPNFFGTLAATCGIEHSFVSLGDDISYHYYNVSVRNGGLCPPIQRVREAVTELILRWNQCCDKEEEKEGWNE